jgi:protein DEK
LAFQDESNESEIAARKVIMRKLKLDIIHRLLDILNIPRGSGDKEAKIDLLIAFLLHPKKMSEVDLAEREAAKRQKLKRKKENDLKRVSRKKKSKRKPKETEKPAEVEKPMSEQDGEEPAEPVMKVLCNLYYLE